MEQQAIDLAQFLAGRLKEIPLSARLIVGLSGVPASGKSSLAKLVIEKFEAIRVVSPTRHYDTEAVAVSLDGWHFTRSQLDCFENPKLAHARRGIHWTFDADAYTVFVRRLREELTPMLPTIYAPSFDHALKDPTPGAIEITSRHRVVLIEGLYTLTAMDPWCEAAQLMDERWFIRVEENEAMRRLINRHVVTNVAKSWEEGLRRAEENDMPNGRFILENNMVPTRIIESVNDPLLALP